MGRYLTPAKIGLLALLELYVKETLPNDAILPILSFIASHLIDHHGSTGHPSGQAHRWSKAERAVGLVITVKDFEKLLGSYPFVMGMPGRRLWDQFLNKLWDINSLHALQEFFDRLTLMLGKTKDEIGKEELQASDAPDTCVKLSHTSPFGAFIRRARLEYQRLQFHDCAELWKDFVRYRQSTAHYLRRKDPNFGRLSFDNVLLLGEQDEDWGPEHILDLTSVVYGDMLIGDHSGTISVSIDDIESLLDFQIEQMQKYGNRVPLEIRHQFHDLLGDSSVVPSLTHYLTFLDAWRAGDYPTAFDDLHRYFDYTMQYRDRLFYQYALMNLAVLQADFGCHKEAVAAMLETVTTARENRDMTCLNFAMNWLFHFGRAHPDIVRDLESDSLLSTGKQTLAFLRVKVKETGMWTLWSSVLLSEAKMSLINGDSVATSLEYMVRGSQIIVERNMKSMFGSQLSLYSSMWNRLGLTALSTIWCENFIRCHASHSVFDDELKTVARLSLTLLERGAYEEAHLVLNSLNKNSLRSWKSNQYCHKYRGAISLKRDLHHNNLSGAEQILGQLLQSKADDLEPDMAFMVDTMHIECLTRRGDLQAALEKVENMTSILRADNRDVAFRIRLYLIKISLLEKCGRPHRAFSTAMRAANIAFQARIIPSLWSAIGALSVILISMDEFEAAVELLIAILPRSLECDMAYLIAQLYSHLVDANMGLAGKQHIGESPGESCHSKRLEYLKRASVAAQKSFEYFAAVEDINCQCEMMAKKATIIRLLGEKALAADYAASYMALRKRADVLSQAS